MGCLISLFVLGFQLIAWTVVLVIRLTVLGVQLLIFGIASLIALIGLAAGPAQRPSLKSPNRPGAGPGLKARFSKHPVWWSIFCVLWAGCLVLTITVDRGWLTPPIVATIALLLVWWVQAVNRQSRERAEQARHAQEAQLEQENQTGVAVRSYDSPAAYQADAPKWAERGWYVADQSQSTMTTGNTRTGYLQHIRLTVTWRRTAPQRLIVEQAAPKTMVCGWCHNIVPLAPLCSRCGAPAVSRSGSG